MLFGFNPFAVHHEGDTVKYENEDYIVTKVWNHGGSGVYYDLKAKKDILTGFSFKGVQLSVHHWELD